MNTRAIGLLLGLMVTSPGKAELGGAPTWPPGNSNHAKTLCAHSFTPDVPYTVHETTFDTGVVVREYVAHAGTVFAVTWDGPQTAPLDVLLGPYFPYFRLALAAKAAGVEASTDSMKVEQSGLVMEVVSHRDSFAGRVYLPRALPAGVRDDSIK